MRYRKQPNDVPPHHFLKLGKPFFIKNFKNNIIHIEDFHNRKSTMKTTSRALAKAIIKKENLWYLFIPLVPIIRLGQTLDKIRGDRLLVVMKNEKN